MSLHRPRHPFIIAVTTAAAAGVLAVAGYGVTHAPVRATQPRPNRTNREVSRQYAQVCYDEATNERVDDSYCKNIDDGESGGGGHSSGGHGWYWVSNSSSSANRVPGVGQKVAGGQTTRPTNGHIYKGISRQGGTFAQSFRDAKSSSNAGKASGDSKYGGKSSKSSSRGGFGSGARTGGGSKGG
ncbi:hypothetical protein [Rothia terrae]|uniref:hypothetical protein n=1 Tax=Rothia terrae TaxID=396015 RepID=UPI0028822F39|nr:hypothetical protein [Rothia terrae]MDT0189659.1 hypothetical protein [Rothia terrae]